jgi:hypothetical protein
MTRETIIEQTIKILSQLPQERVEEIADFVFKKYEGQILTIGIQEMISDSKAFRFLAEDEDLYSITDLKERFHD